MQNNTQTVSFSASLLNNYKDESSIAGYLMAQLAQANGNLTKAAIFLDEELLPQAYIDLINNRRCGSRTLYRNIEAMSLEQKRTAFVYNSPQDGDIGDKFSVNIQEIYLYSTSYQAILQSLKSLTPESSILISMVNTVANSSNDADIPKQIKDWAKDKALWVTKIIAEDAIPQSPSQQL